MDDLADIIRNGFTARYCLENYTNLFCESEKEFRIAFPMTCFCDLPLSQLHKHLDFYGGYGIGMTKQWGINKRINPVLYMHERSYLAEYIGLLLNDIKHDNKENNRTMCRVLSILRHIKPYDGHVIVNGRNTSKRFYDEREWRWVPFLTGNNHNDILSLSDDEFNDPIKREKANSEILDMARLDFHPEDIKYIVVPCENDILEMTDRIDKMHDIYAARAIRLLCTRIISAKQIKQDF